jgi:chemotaxis methyl-accepting protein methylase
MLSGIECIGYCKVVYSACSSREEAYSIGITILNAKNARDTQRRVRSHGLRTISCVSP